MQNGSTKHTCQRQHTISDYVVYVEFNQIIEHVLQEEHALKKDIDKWNSKLAARFNLQVFFMQFPFAV